MIPCRCGNEPARRFAGDDFGDFIALDKEFLSAFRKGTSAGCTHLVTDITPRAFISAS